jgi:hypothetical protein
MAVREFLRSSPLGRGRPTAPIADDTPLVESGLLTSLMVADLLLLLEELRGCPLDPAALSPGAFRDIDTIVSRFLQEEPSCTP